ncbi:hypothetical protein DBZ36_12815 [Alginatibacterium sediminis]|uniref:KfrA N-terminal DNA-binding domain-containing protein n=1 Tax=Alginatibacterium sediminis TaxID=2164068 RepID=A0A420EBR0_9ALTE|nr:hypothetical protein [Alginatibacterium sediminis]RKF18111.1 hypothetical protein DBZ36_12815 [Alginatibacterium sediminis]
MSIDVLEQALVTVIRQGKEPSMAQIKAQLAVSVPMRDIIACLQNYKRSPDYFHELAKSAEYELKPVPISKPEQDDSTLLLAQLQRDHLALQQRVEILEQMLKELSDKT